LTTLILDFVSQHTAGSPTDPAVKWTALRPLDIAIHLKEQHQVKVSHNCIKRILKADGYVKRKPIKCLSTGISKHRAEQFNIVNFLRTIFEDMEHNPTISIDTKKKND
jgi:hypothetical protein